MSVMDIYGDAAVVSIDWRYIFRQAWDDHGGRD